MKIGAFLSMLLFVACAGMRIAAAAEAPSTYDTAFGLFRSKHFAEAIALLDPFIAAHPKDGKALILRGDCKSEMGDEHAALVDYNAGIAAAPEYQYGYVTRCQTRYNLDDDEGALRDCEMAVKLDPKDGRAYEARADVYFDRDAYSAALQDYNTAIDLGQASAYDYAARCDTERILNVLDGAATDCKKSQELDPDLIRGLWASGRLALSTKRYDDAVTFFTRYIARKDDTKVGYYYRGLTYNRNREYPAALADLEKYVGLAPGDADGYRERAVALYNTGDKAGAIADLTKAVELYKRDGDGDSAAAASKALEDAKAGRPIASAG
jgi:tetratricopeptide (TPR) repeat protein